MNFIFYFLLGYTSMKHCDRILMHILKWSI